MTTGSHATTAAGIVAAAAVVLTSSALTPTASRYAPLTCSYPDLSQMWFKGMSELYVSTMVTATKTIKFTTLQTTTPGLSMAVATAQTGPGTSVTLTGATSSGGGAVSILAGAKVSGTNVDAGTTVVSYDSTSKSLELSQQSSNAITQGTVLAFDFEPVAGKATSE